MHNINKIKGIKKFKDYQLDLIEAKRKTVLGKYGPVDLSVQTGKDRKPHRL